MKQKQLTGMYGYLGSFVTLDDLQARYPAPRLSSYAFVGEKYRRSDKYGIIPIIQANA